MLTQVEDVIPKWKIVPTKDVINAAFKDPTKREEVSYLHQLCCSNLHQFSVEYGVGTNVLT